MIKENGQEDQENYMLDFQPETLKSLLMKIEQSDTRRFILIKENPKVLRKIKKFDIESDFQIKLVYNYNVKILRLKLEDPINKLIEDIMDYFGYHDENKLEIKGNFTYDDGEIDIKNMRWKKIDFLFTGVIQSFQFKIFLRKQIVSASTCCIGEEEKEYYVDDIKKLIEDKEQVAIYKLNTLEGYNKHKNLDIEFKKFKISFLNLNAFKEFTEFLKNNRFRLDYLIISFDFSLNEIIYLEYIIQELNLFLQIEESRKIKISLNFSCLVRSLSISSLEEKLKNSKFIIEAISIYDQLFSFMKFDLLNNFLEVLNRTDNLKNLKVFFLENTKIDNLASLEKLFSLLVQAKNLSNLKLKYIKIELPQNDYPHFYLNSRQENITINFNSDKISPFPKLKYFEVLKTKLFSIKDLANCAPQLSEFHSFIFDIDSIVNSEYFPIEKFVKEDEKIKMTVNNYIKESNFVGYKYLPPNLNELKIKDFTNEREGRSLALFGTLLKNSDLHQITRLSFTRYEVHTNQWLNKILEDFSMSKLNSIYLKEMQKETCLRSFFKRCQIIEKFEIIDSYISYNSESYEDIGEYLKCIKIQSLRLKFSNLFNLNKQSNIFDETLDLIVLILQNCTIHELILEDQIFNMIFNNKKILLIPKSISKVTLRNIRCKVCDEQIRIRCDSLFIKGSINFSMIEKLKDKFLVNYKKIHIDYSTFESLIFHEQIVSSLEAYLNFLVEKKADNKIQIDSEKLKRSLKITNDIEVNTVDIKERNKLKYIQKNLKDGLIQINNTDIDKLFIKEGANVIKVKNF
jgi:hypothetical protein